MGDKFPRMILDTTLRFATRARSQVEAGNPDCYRTKRGGMVNTNNNEEEEAKNLILVYQVYI
jgi:hypothetical protein